MPPLGNGLDLDSISIDRLDRKTIRYFIKDAFDSSRAEKYLQEQKLLDSNFSEFLNAWKSLVREVTKGPNKIVSRDLRVLTRERDRDRCCITGIESWESRAEPFHILPPSLVSVLANDTPSKSECRRLLEAFLSPDICDALHELLQDEPTNGIRNSWMIGPKVETSFRRGYFKLIPEFEGVHGCFDLNTLGWDCKYTFSFTREDEDPFKLGELKTSDEMDIDEKTYFFKPRSERPPQDPLLFYVHSRLSRTSSWLDFQNRMRAEWSGGRASPQSTTSKVLHKSWLSVPAPTRAWIYDILRVYSSLAKLSPLLPWVRQLPFGLYLKRERAGGNGNEAAALRLVQEHTSIPVPSLIDEIEDPPGNKYIITRRIPGRPVSDMLRILSDKEISQFIQDLQSCISELHSIPQSSTQHPICGVNGGPLFDYRLPRGVTGPFTSQDSFHDALVTSATSLSENARSVAQNNRVSEINSQVRFTHGDLNFSNIFVTKGGRISGIPDWECAGFYPEYWEKSKALYTVAGPRGGKLGKEWMKIMDRAIPGYETELEIERILWGLSSRHQ